MTDAELLLGLIADAFKAKENLEDSRTIEIGKYGWPPPDDICVEQEKEYDGCVKSFEEELTKFIQSVISQSRGQVDTDELRKFILGTVSGAKFEVVNPESLGVTRDAIPNEITGSLIPAEPIVGKVTHTYCTEITLPDESERKHPTISDLITVEMEIDAVCKSHTALMDEFNEHPFNLNNKIAYHQSYSRLADIMQKWRNLRNELHEAKPQT